MEIYKRVAMPLPQRDMISEKHITRYVMRKIFYLNILLLTEYSCFIILT